MAGRVAGKAAFITGAARGQGRPHRCSGTCLRFKDDAP
jgi:hypothetical protein